MKLNLNNTGVTLIELMFVVIILAVGILPIAVIQAQSHRDIFESGQRTRALNIANMQMERVRNLGFANAVADSGTIDTFNWNTQIQPQSFGLNTVTVTVVWPERDDTQMIQLRNLISTR